MAPSRGRSASHDIFPSLGAASITWTPLWAVSLCFLSIGASGPTTQMVSESAIRPQHLRRLRNGKFRVQDDPAGVSPSPFDPGGQLGIIGQNRPDSHQNPVRPMTEFVYELPGRLAP